MAFTSLEVHITTDPSAVDLDPADAPTTGDGAAGGDTDDQSTLPEVAPDQTTPGPEQAPGGDLIPEGQPPTEDQLPELPPLDPVR